MKNNTLITITDTDRFLKMVINSKGRNRSVDLKEIKGNIDPLGKHLLKFKMVHNSKELRTQWLVKVKGSSRPIEIWLDLNEIVFLKNTTQLLMVS